jgi:branched-chain amino acid transport system permease protein
MTYAIVSGLIVSGSFLLLTLGFTLMLRVADIVNLLHGIMVVAGMYLMVVFVNVLGLTYVQAIVPAVLVGLVIFWLLYELLLRSARREGHRTQIIYTLLLFSLIQTALEILFGGDPTRVRLQRVSWQVLDVAVRREEAIGALLAVATTVGFFLMFRFTALGKSMEIAGKYPEGAAAIGLPVERLYRYVWLIGSAMALLGGVFLVAGTPVTPFLGLEYLVIAVIVSISARLSFAGVVAAAILLGLGNPVLVAITQDPQLASVAVYGFFLCVIALTPLASDFRPLRRLLAG